MVSVGVCSNVACMLSVLIQYASGLAPRHLHHRVLLIDFKQQGTKQADFLKIKIYMYTCNKLYLDHGEDIPVQVPLQ